MSTEAEEISSDHVYATGRDIGKLLGKLEALELRVLNVEKSTIIEPKKTMGKKNG